MESYTDIVTPSHGQRMSSYYSWQAGIYDATRWMFLYDRDTILADLKIAPGETVIEVGCGTGRNLGSVVRRVGEQGRVLAVDCAEPMLSRCAARIKRNDWKNTRLVECEYGSTPVSGGEADVVLMSYSLSMIPNWIQALECAGRDLKPGGRIGVLDFCLAGQSPVAMGFSRWMALNHVALDRPYLEKLSSAFLPIRSEMQKAFGGLWRYYRFIGQKPQ